MTLTASVETSGPVTVGQVNFCDGTAAYCTGGYLLGTAQLTSAGTATLRFVPGAGNHSYKAMFAGTAAAAASSSSVSTLYVSGSYPTITTIADGGAPGSYTLTASVKGAALATPTGAVSFLDTTNGGYSLASSALSSGTTILEPIAVVDFNG